MDYDLSPEVRERLLRLAFYLDTLPRNYSEFDMDSFFEGKDDDVSGKLERRYARKNGGVAACGTTACAIGHGPSAGIPVPDVFIGKDSSSGKWRVNWSAYGDLFTGPDNDMMIYKWLFDSDWSDVDNHHYGAAARIKYLLMGEKIPDDFLYAKEEHRALYAKYRKRKFREQDAKQDDTYLF